MKGNRYDKIEIHVRFYTIRKINSLKGENKGKTAVFIIFGETV